MARERLTPPDREIFVDTGAWFSLADRSSPHHEAVTREVRRRVPASRLVTTNLIVAETHALLLRRANARAGLTFLREVRRPPNILVWSDSDLELRAEREWIERYADQDFTLTDAVSFAVMRERGITRALTLDRHFAAAGFSMVPATR